jgi:hypothetical protein
MKNGDDMSAVIKDLRKDNALLAAFLTVSDTWRVLHRRVPEAHQASAVPKSPVSPFEYRRANLVRCSESSRKAHARGAG